MYHRLILLGAVLSVVGWSCARAEMLQFSTPDGTKSWPKLNDPADWHQDLEASQRLGVNFLIPDGVDPANAEVTIQARGFPRANNSLSNLLEKDRSASPGAEVRKLPDVTDTDGVPFHVYSFAGAGSWKAVGYSEEGDTLLAFTFSARSKAAYDGNFPVFESVIQKYAKDIPW